MVCAKACTIAVGHIIHGNSEKNLTALCEDDIVGGRSWRGSALPHRYGALGHR